jgi:signal peptidase II
MSSPPSETGATAGGSRGLLRKLLVLSVIAGLVVLLDQVTKMLILRSLPLHDSFTVIPGFFNITHVHNPGGAFGLLADQSPLIRKILFLAVSALASLVVLYFYLRTPSGYRWLSAGFALIFGGAVGNLIDRLRFGIVVDFLSFYIGPYHWPAFNVADSAITVGVVIFGLHILFNKLPD